MLNGSHTGGSCADNCVESLDLLHPASAVVAVNTPERLVIMGFSMRGWFGHGDYVRVDMPNVTWFGWVYDRTDDNTFLIRRSDDRHIITVPRSRMTHAA